MQAQEEAELAQLQKAKRKALEQRDAQMRQLDDLKARILAERCPSILFSLSMWQHVIIVLEVLTCCRHTSTKQTGRRESRILSVIRVLYLVCDLGRHASGWHAAAAA